MRAKKSKQIRKAAKAMETVNKVYVTKVDNKIYHDLQGNPHPYQTTQVRLIPQCIKRIVKTLKGSPKAWTLEELKDKGYEAV